MPDKSKTKNHEGHAGEALKHGKNSSPKGSRLLCCYQLSADTLKALFKDDAGHIDKVEVSGFKGTENSADCTCGGNNNGKLCQHANAALAHYSKFRHQEHHETAHADAPAKYAGLKYEGFPELISGAINPPKAEISLNAETEFPHVPSKWEKVIISATLHYGTRDYIGNLSNLRQLHFGKNMAASLQASYFSQQDRQIIRFLAINAESEDSKLSLDSEQTAELFHCLSGFKRFSRNGEQIIIHREIAEPVLVCRKSKDAYQLYPAALVDGSLLPMKSEKVIIGRAGCWLGVSGEYWWMPAFVDVGWLRSYLRSEEQSCDVKSAELLLSGKTNFPLKVIESSLKELPSKKSKILMCGDFDLENVFNLDVSFDYEKKIFSADGARLASSDGHFWSRDSRLEKDFLNELLSFGFEKNSSGVSDYSLSLHDIETAGIFLDEYIPLLIGRYDGIYLSAVLSAVSGTEHRVPELSFICSLEKENHDSFDLKYRIFEGDFRISWSRLAAELKHNRNFMFVREHGLIKIPPALRKLVEAASNIVTIPEGNNEILKIPRFAAAYWAEMASRIPGAVPPEFLSIANFMKDAARDGENAKFFMDEENTKVFKFEGSLRNYQKQGVAWMRELSAKGYNLILADEMGLGKTIQALAMLAISKSENPSLVLCPSSLVENWAREAMKFVPSFKVLSISGPEREKLWKKYNDYDLIISSYALAKRDVEMLKDCTFNYFILDEAQHIKNPSTANAKSCKIIKSAHRLVLTGTPLENSPEDLWSIFDFLHPGLLGNLNAFKNNYADLHKNKDKQDDLAARVSPFILRRKKKKVCSELPPKLEQALYCEMESGQREIYEQFLIRGREQCELLKTNKDTSKFKILTALLRLRQICCHPELLPKEFGGANLASAKMDLLHELLFENIDSGHKLLVFSQFTSLLKIIRKWLEEEKIKYEYLDGSTTNRLEHVDNFNNSKSIPVFLLSLKAGGTGLNLTSADTVIIYDPWWNPAVEAQAADRTHRIGQTVPVNSIKLVVKDSIEERILELQKKKQLIFDSLVENPSNSLKHFDISDLEFLLK